MRELLHSLIKSIILTLSLKISSRYLLHNSIYSPIIYQYKYIYICTDIKRSHRVQVARDRRELGLPAHNFASPKRGQNGFGSVKYRPLHDTQDTKMSTSKVQQSQSQINASQVSASAASNVSYAGSMDTSVGELAAIQAQLDKMSERMQPQQDRELELA